MSGTGAGVVHVRAGRAWRIIYQPKLARSASFTAVESTSPSDAWAVGDYESSRGAAGGFASHWNGHRWRLVPFPVSDFVPVSVAASTKTDVWVFGYLRRSLKVNPGSGVALRRTSNGWRMYPLPADHPYSWAAEFSLTPVVLGPDDVWLTGGYACLAPDGRNCTSAVWHLSGGTWTRQILPAAVADISGSSDVGLWAVGTTSANNDTRARAFRWSGTTWKPVAIPWISHPSVAAYSGRDVWLTGNASRAVGGFDSRVAHWNGSRWTAVRLPWSGGGTAGVNGRGGVWFGSWFYESRGAWYMARPPRLGGRSCDLGTAVASVPGTTASWLLSTCANASGNHLTTSIGLIGRP